MRIERIGGLRLDTDSEVWDLDQTTWRLMWAGDFDLICFYYWNSSLEPLLEGVFA